MYDGIKNAAGSSIKIAAPLKTNALDCITDSNNRIDRLVEHYIEQFSNENTVAKETQDTDGNVPIVEELDNAFTLDEFTKTIDSLTSGIAPGNYGIPLEIFKHEQRALLQTLYELIRLY